jgi:putative ABC transport system permease protein
MRWSLRDLRRRWPLVVAIALLLAGGTGLAAGLGSMKDWRIASNDASFAALDVHDLRVQAEQGSFVPQGSLERAAAAIPAAGEVAGASERLIAPTQITLRSATGQRLINPGQLVGVVSEPEREVDGVRVTGPEVDSIEIASGDGLSAGNRGRVAMLDPQYAKFNDVEVPTSLSLPGGRDLRVAGLGRSPETFVLLGPAGSFSSEQSFSPVFLPLAEAQAAAGRPGQVNDLALKLAPGADPAEVRSQLENELSRRFPGTGFELTGTRDIDGYRILYDDAANDQQLFDVFAFLILAGAAFGAFNLISRTIESQRREIGVGMALGVQPSRLAIRPMLMGLQIAVLGVLLGVAVGLAVNEWLGAVMADQLPLPVVDTGLRADVFAERAAIGLLIPLIAAAWPVMRGVRVTPVEAIRAGFRSARGSGLAPLLARIPSPGGSLARIPARNVLRAPRRTLLTVLAGGAVISVVVSMSGMLDSFEKTVDRNSAEELKTAPQRLEVTLDRFYPAGSTATEGLASSPGVGPSDARLVVPATISDGSSESFDISLETVPGPRALWAPTVSDGRPPGSPDQILLAESAAKDLDVSPGDTVRVEHPRALGPGRFASVTSEFTVSGLHPDPFRFPAYIDESGAARLGLAGQVNVLDVVPAAGTSEGELKLALLANPAVASIQEASTLSEALDEGLEQFAEIIRVVVAIAIVLVLLIAFNSTAINAEERAREHATMMAYGVPVGTVLRLAVIENLIIGVLATAFGVGLGLLILGWVVNVNLKEVLPELGAAVALSPESVLIAALAGAGAMAIAPLLTYRRMRRMDIPSTLRVVE